MVHSLRFDAPWLMIFIQCCRIWHWGLDRIVSNLSEYTPRISLHICKVFASHKETGKISNIMASTEESLKYQQEVFSWFGRLFFFSNQEIWEISIMKQNSICPENFYRALFLNLEADSFGKHFFMVRNTFWVKTNILFKRKTFLIETFTSQSEINFLFCKHFSSVLLNWGK